MKILFIVLSLFSLATPAFAFDTLMIPPSCLNVEGYSFGPDGLFVKCLTNNGIVVYPSINNYPNDIPLFHTRTVDSSLNGQVRWIK